MGLHDDFTRQESLSVFVSHALFLLPLPLDPGQSLCPVGGVSWWSQGRPIPWDLEHIWMDSPTNYMCNWHEGSSPPKAVFYHTQVRNRLHLNDWNHCEESGFVVVCDFPSSQFSGSVETHKASWHNTNMEICDWLWMKNGRLFPPDTMALGLSSLTMCCSKLLPTYLGFQTWPQGQAMEEWSWCVLQEMGGGTDRGKSLCAQRLGRGWIFISGANLVK